MIDIVKIIKKLNNQLGDFQKATVDYVVKRMLDDGQNRMLIADEVGLGKTWIAKAVIAYAYERHCQNKNGKCFNVYYICSNQQLAAQNIAKVNFTGNKDFVSRQINRISLLALKPKHENVPVRIYSLTPDTSFSVRSSQGIKEERRIIYSILKDEFNRQHTGQLSGLLMGSRNINEWDKFLDDSIDIKDCVGNKYISKLKNIEVGKEMLPKTFDKYLQQEKMTLWCVVEGVLRCFNRDEANNAIYDEVIGALRKAMIDVCLEHMEADFFIMDEFQRYAQLLDSKDVTDEIATEQDMIAKKVFGQEGAKVLMLSATPFKAYTTQNDEQLGQKHYEEFVKVLKFLYAGTKPQPGWDNYNAVRGELYSFMLQLGKLDVGQKKELWDKIKEKKEWLEKFYSAVIVRTEKIIASDDPNAMIDSKDGMLDVTEREIRDFMTLDKAFMSIYGKKNELAPVPVDYAKSAPYAMSYLCEYKVAEKAHDNDVDLQNGFDDVFIKRDDINIYKFPNDGKWPHGKLQLLMKDMVRESKLLWCPPSLPYYDAGGAYTDMERFSKTLVFSAWNLVPKMIATLVSYEAEKYTLGELRERRETQKDDRYKVIKYFVEDSSKESRRPRPRLVFNENAMTTLLLAYPSKMLADSWKPLYKECTCDWKDKIVEFCNVHGVEAKRPLQDVQICWALPMLEDSGKECSWIEKVLEQMPEQEEKKSYQYIEKLYGILSGPSELNLSVPKELEDVELEKLADIMTKLAKGSPAVCAYRALRRYYDEKESLVCAFKIGMGFIELFNKPESIAIVDLQYSNLDYWQKVINYCYDGNLQAVLDEYVFMLRNEYNDIEDLTAELCSALTMRTSVLKVDDNNSFSTYNLDNRVPVDNNSDCRLAMRSHFAAAFGVNTKKDNGSENRAVNVRKAFNSPFKPFVLATTSIGQEGLDFHWYCRRIMHWNLPNNPVDFEQREGRINRFRGKVIRQRVADVYKDQIPRDCNKPWEEMFSLAKKNKDKNKCDIVPDWHFDSNGGNAVAVERIVPLYRFSKDVQRYENMSHVLGLYKLAFGQPRQEDLVEALGCDLTDDEKKALLIDMCPLHHSNKQPALCDDDSACTQGTVDAC